MLHKRHNSVITLTILLTLVGISKPAKAFLLAQSDAAKTTFTIPDKLPENANVQIAASNSTTSINEDLKENFIAKYPNAKVEIATTSSDDALNAVLEGKADLVAIGRNLTAAEKAKGLFTVPISREKIAIVVSKNNPYDGNLTISQFAQIFRGEITDWSEIGGSPGSIKLVDLPDSNDTRQAFPSYPVFKEQEFKTGSNATQVDRDDTEAMIAQLGKDGIGYAVADDVINRDDVKVVTMHQTQPDDPRYPFSQPFSLVYQGTPSEATAAFLGFATTEEGQQTIAKRVGSLSAIQAAAFDSNLTKESPGAVADGDVEPGVDGVADGDVEPGVDGVADGDVEPGVDGVADKVAQADLDGSSEVNSDLDGSGEVNSDLDGSGEVNSDLDGSGEVNSDLDGSGEVNPDLDGSGEVNPDLDGSGELDSEANGDVNPEAQGNSEIDVDANEQDGVIAKKNNNSLWWWLPIVLGIPLLGVLAYKFAGGKKKSDQEPAISSIATPDNPQGGTSATFDPDLDNPPTGGPNLGNVTANTAGTTSKIGGAAIATGGAALAGGAIAADNAANTVGSIGNTKEDIDLDPIELENVVAQPETDINSPIIEIPSNPVSEFTDQETKLQTTEQSTKLQTDSTDDIGDASSGLFDNISPIGGVAAAGGAAAAAGFLGNREDSVEETEETFDLDRDNETYVQSGDVSEQTTKLQTGDVQELNPDEMIASFDQAINDTSSKTQRGREFEGDFVLDEEDENIVVDAVESADTATNNTNWVDGTTQESPSSGGGVPFTLETPETELSDPQQTVIDETPSSVDDTAIDGTNTNWVDGTIQESPSSGGGVPFTLETPETELSDPQQTVIDETPSSVDDTAIDGTAFVGGAAAIGGAAAAGFFTNQDSEQPTEIDAVDSTDTAIDDTNTNWVDGTIQESPSSSEEANIFDINDSSNSSLDQIANSADVSLEEITFDDSNDLVNASLDEITFDDSNDSVDISLDEITFDGSNDSVNASLDEITFDDSNDSVDISLDEITFDDDNDDSIDELINSIQVNTSNKQEVSLDELGFETQSKDNINPDLLSNKNADITDLSDERAGDMNNISTWLDSLETPNTSKNTENIAEWLDNLSADRSTDNGNPAKNEDNNEDGTFESETQAEDISFQFLEDLLDRDFNANQDNK